MFRPPQDTLIRLELTRGTTSKPGRRSELLQEAEIVLEKEPDVIDVELEHRDALNAHSEGKAVLPLRRNPEYQ